MKNSIVKFTFETPFKIHFKSKLKKASKVKNQSD
jgi:hypothetical protein